MSEAEEEKKALVRKLFKEVWSKGNVAAVDAGSVRCGLRVLRTMFPLSCIKELRRREVSCTASEFFTPGSPVRGNFVPP